MKLTQSQHRFKDGDIDDPAYRKSIVDIFVNSIFLYDDKLVIAFNWKDGSKTVTLAELDAAINSAGITNHRKEPFVLAKFSGSHLDAPREPHQQRSRTLADNVKLVGEGFGYVFYFE